MGLYCQEGAKTRVCAQQPEVAGKLQSATSRGSAALLQVEQVGPGAVMELRWRNGCVNITAHK